MLGDDPEHQLLSLASYHQRRARLLHGLGLAIGVFYLVVLAVERCLPLSPQELDDLRGFVQSEYALPRRVERDAEGVVLKLEPARAYPHY
jgi:hypothetical protein